MTIIMHNPPQIDFNDAVYKASDGIISAEWRVSAWEAIRTWIQGSVSSNPFGLKSSYPVRAPLTVSWAWVKGELTVVVVK